MKSLVLGALLLTLTTAVSAQTYKMQDSTGRSHDLQIVSNNSFDAATLEALNALDTKRDGNRSMACLYGTVDWTNAQAHQIRVQVDSVKGMDIGAQATCAGQASLGAIKLADSLPSDSLVQEKLVVNSLHRLLAIIMTPVSSGGRSDWSLVGLFTYSGGKPYIIAIVKQ